MRFTVTKALSVFLAGWALLAGMSAAEARDVIISFKDGRTIQGEYISEDSDSISISIATIKTSYKKADIKGVQNKLTVDEEYQQKKQALKSGDVEGWYNLAYWLYSQKSFDKSLVEIDALLAAITKPGALKAEESSYLDRAKILRTMVTGEIAKLKSEPGKTPAVKPTPGSTTPAASQPTSSTQNGIQQQYQDRRMTDAQLNMIRLYEIVDPREERPKVTIKREALDAFLRDYRDKPDGIRDRADMDRFRGSEGWVQLDILFKFKARELYPSVTVHEDPKNMLVFKKNIHSSYILNYCGTSTCHGGAEAGNLFLFTLDPSSPRTVYSNFFNLYTWQDNTGYMINLDVPSDSYLIQYGQPADVKNAMFLAKKPHPSVKGWQPKFRALQDPMQTTIENWIVSLGRARNDYGIDYIPPVVSPGAKPAQRTFAPASVAPAAGGDQSKKAVPR